MEAPAQAPEVASLLDKPPSPVSAKANGSRSGDLGAGTSGAMIKYGSLGLLVAQNSALFVVTRFTLAPQRKGRMYLSSVVVLLVELAKLLICLAILIMQSGGSLCKLRRELVLHIWTERRMTLLLGVPATCYAVQNNLIFISLSNLSATAAQVLYQLKTISTAFFTVVLLGRSFALPQWVSFVLLTAGVVLVQSQDAKSARAPTGTEPVLGVAAALGAAGLSGFAGVFLEKVRDGLPTHTPRSRLLTSLPELRVVMLDTRLPPGMLCDC